MRVENDVINRILDAYKPMWSLNHAICLMGWDFETYMPKKGMEERGVADSQLHMLHKAYQRMVKIKNSSAWICLCTQSAS